MIEKLSKRDCVRRSVSAENGQSPNSGTAVANYRDTSSCDLSQPSEAEKGTWGGARNRADRTSEGLSEKQALELWKSARYAIATGRVFQRHWIIHYGNAGIHPAEGARFVGRVLDKLSRYIKRRGGRLTAIWVRECASEKGEHVHILFHASVDLDLRGWTRRWIVQAGGTVRDGVSRIRPIGGRIAKVGENRSERQVANAENVARYMLKATNAGVSKRLGLGRFEEWGRIVGKRCGVTQNIGHKKQARTLS